MRTFIFLFLIAAVSAANTQTLEHDISADLIISPIRRAAQSVATPVQIRYTNRGINDENHVKLFAEILDYQGAILYFDSVSIDSIWQSGQTLNISYKDFIPARRHGYQVVVGFSSLSDDENTSNDSAYAFFCTPFILDAAALAVTSPAPNAIIDKNSILQLSGLFWAPGCYPDTNVPVRIKITRYDGQLVFQADTIMPYISLDSNGTSITFPSQQGRYNTQNLSAGRYKIALISNNVIDVDYENDTVYSYFFIGSGDYINVETLLSPYDREHFNRDSLIPIIAKFKNVGVNTEAHIEVGVNVSDRKGKLVMQDTSIQTNWSIGESRTIMFKSFSSPINGTFGVFCWAYYGDDLGVGINIGDGNDLAVVSIANPTPNEKISFNTGFTPVGIFRWVGYGDFMDFIHISAIIAESDGKIIFRSDTIIPSISADSGNMKFPLPEQGEDGNYIKDILPGLYHICIFLNEPSFFINDSNYSNDTACSQFEIISNASVVNSSENSFSIQNFPSPFLSSTTIKYTLPEAGLIIFQIFDVTGRIVQTEINHLEDAGNHEMSIDLENFPSGVYTCQVLFLGESGKITTKSNKLIHLREK